MVGSPSGEKSYKISFKIKQNMELNEFAEMGQKLKGTQPKEEDSLFYYHSSEETVAISKTTLYRYIRQRNANQ